MDECTTNFPKEIWDPNNVDDEWFADRIGTSFLMNITQKDRCSCRFNFIARHYAQPFTRALPMPFSSSHSHAHRHALAHDVCGDWYFNLASTVYAADYQKTHSERQAAAQCSGKRTQIEFTSSKPSLQANHHDMGQKNRFNPYLNPYDGGKYKKEKGRSKWGVI